MKTKIKITIFIFVAPIILGAFFIFSQSKIIMAEEASFYNDFIVSEIMYDPVGSNTEHSKWIEIYNIGDDYEFNATKSGDLYKISDFYICDGLNKTTGLCTKHYIYSDTEDPIFKSKEYLVVAQNADKFMADYSGLKKPLKSALAIDGSEDAFVKICFQDDGHCTDVVEYGSFDIAEKEGYSLEKIDLIEKNSEKNWQRSYQKNGTPTTEKSERINYPEGIVINELFPHPIEEDESEFIELYNSTKNKVLLEDWVIVDRANKTCKLDDEIIGSEDFLFLEENDGGCDIALNDTGGEIVKLLDPNGDIVFEAEYATAKEGLSYSFDGKDWHWSKFLTPGEENKFEKIPDGELKIDEYVYVNVFANFEISGLSKKAKVTWDFGDGHKSYLQKTKHKYKETGKYEASIKYSEGSEDVIKNFSIEVKKIPHPEVKIIAVNANPEGKDSEKETITLQNKSKKKVNLNGWSIATGWKKLINHPISADFEIKAGKKKEITREFSLFTLNNKKAEIELRYPDGKVADGLKYNKKKDSIAEGEIYIKEKKKWKWVAGATAEKPIESIKQEESANLIIENPEVINDEQGTIPEGDIVSKPIFERENKLAFNQKNFFKINLANNYPRVLGAETVREADDAYFFTSGQSQQEHYAIIFIKNIFAIINLKINFAINFFLN